MLNVPPPPTWAEVSDPAWLNWFLTISNNLSGVGATIAAGFTQALNGTPKYCGSPVSGVSGFYADTDLTLTTTEVKRVLYWVEVGWTVYGAVNVLTTPRLYRDSTLLRVGAQQVSAVGTQSYSQTMLYAEDLPAGTHNIKLGVNADTAWNNYPDYALIINPRVVLMYAP